MVLDSVFLFLDDCSFKFIPKLKSVSLGDLFSYESICVKVKLSVDLHSLMVEPPGLSEDVTLLVQLSCDVVT